MNEINLKQKSLISQIQMMSGLSTTDFLLTFLGYKQKTGENPQMWANLKAGDYFTKSLFSEAEQYICNYDKWIMNVEKKFSFETKEEVLNNLLVILESDDLYYYKSNPARNKLLKPDVYKKYNEEYRNKMIVAIKKSLESPMYISNRDVYSYLWAVIYLAVYKRIPDSFLIGDRLHKDTQEYNRRILLRYGGNTTPSHRAIYTLAKEGNVVAQTELADLYYYGQINKNLREYRKAFYWYSRAAGDLDNPSAVHHPLACWCLAYMLFNYRFRRDLKNKVSIPEIESMSVLERRKKAIQYCVLALENDDGLCAQAYNLIGVIMDVMESIVCDGDRKEVSDAEVILNIIKGNDTIQKILGSKSCTPEAFFKIASDGGYVEASNNLSRRELKRAIFETNNKLEHIKKACVYLDKSSMQNSTWASNKMGELFRLGKVSVYLEEFEKNETIYIDTLINPKKALHYYLRAIECFYDKDSAWAAVHLLESFSDELDVETENHCREIIAIVKDKDVLEYCSNNNIVVDNFLYM